MKCNKCGYDDSGSGDMAHVCQRPSFRYGEHPTSFGLFNPKQEPVAWMNDEGDVVTDQKWAKDQHYTTPLYTTPPQPEFDYKEHAEGLQRDYDLLLAEYNALKNQSKLEPVAWLHTKIEGVAVPHRPADLDKHPDRWEALYKTPPPCPTCEALARTVMLDQTSHDTTTPQRKPLTREQIVKCQEEASDEWCGVEELFVLYARAIEAAHGIKE